MAKSQYIQFRVSPKEKATYEEMMKRLDNDEITLSEIARNAIPREIHRLIRKQEKAATTAA